MEYSHRDLRAYRSALRGFLAVLTTVVGLTLLALVSPVPALGWVAVLALALVGIGGVVWAERLVDRYRRDLEVGRGPSRGSGFARAEVSGRFELDRAVGRPTERSPHARRRVDGSSPVPAPTTPR